MTSRVALDFLHGLESNRFEVYTDNYYTSPQLYLYLYNQGTNAVGTCKVNRQSFPKELIFPNQCPWGTYKYRSNGPLLACAWFDKRPVYFLSTSHVAVPSGCLSTVKRSDGPNKVDVSCPPLLEDYIKFMRGVDCGDITLYNAGRRSKKWWQRILFHMIEVCLLNGYALEGCVKPRSRGHKKRDLSFRIEVAEMLIGAYRGRKRAGRKRKRDEDRLEPTLQHLPVYGDSLGDSVVCTKKGGELGISREVFRHRCHFQCSYCNVHLCITADRNCFYQYHSNVEYWR